MNSTTKKAACLALAALMTASCAACGSSSSSTASSAATSSAATSSAATSSAASSSSSAEIVKGGTMKIGIRASLTSIGYPGKLSTTSEQLCCRPAIECLCVYDENGDVQPYLCKSYEEDKEKATITIHLREGVKFHDGTECNADAVIYNLETNIKVKKTTFPCGDLTFSKTDDWTVVVQMPSYASTVLATLTTCAGVGFMVSAEYEKAHEDDVETVYKNPIGTGPFKFVSWDGDTLIKYEKNTEYWGTEANLDAIEIHLFQDDSTALSAFTAGDVDCLMQTSSDMVEGVQSMGDKAYTNSKYPATGMMVQGIQINNVEEGTPWSDLKVRQAMMYAIDGSAITQSFKYGLYVETNQWAIPGSDAYNSEVQGYSYDVEKAKSLLKEAGYESGFEITGTYTATNSQLKNVLTYVQAYLQQIGITVNMNPVEQSVQNELTANSTWSGMIVMSQGNNEPKNNVYSMGRYFNASSKARFSGANGENADIAELAAKAAVGTLADNVSAQKAINKIVIDDKCLFQPFYTYNANFICRSYVQGCNFGDTHQVQWTPETAGMTAH